MHSNEYKAKGKGDTETVSKAGCRLARKFTKNYFIGDGWSGWAWNRKFVKRSDGGKWVLVMNMEHNCNFY